MKSFDSKVAAITGAGSGIGRALALNLAKQGCALAVSDVDEQGLQETLDQLKDFDIKVTSQKLDVADRKAIYAWADQVVADHGQVNLIFNNAGVALGSSVEGMDDDDLEWLMDINFWGVVNGTRAFMPHLKASGAGHIINTSSIFGLAGIPSQSAYNASKFAVRGFTESLRQELDLSKSCVSATSVHPGGIKTNIAASARFSDNMQDLVGASADDAKANFEKLFITTADKAAKVILRAVKRNQRRVLIGPDAYAVDLMVRFMPSTYQRLVMLGTKLQMR